MLSKMKLALASVFGIFMVLSSCMSEKAMVNKYYVIEPPGRQVDETLNGGEVIHRTCELEPVKVRSLIDKNQIVNRSQSNEITYYLNHQWAVRPSVSIMELVSQELEHIGIFEGVSTRFSRIVPDYRLNIFVTQLEVLESKRSFSAHLEVEFRLLRNADSEILVAYQADKTRPMEEKDLNLFAAEISDMLTSELQTFISRIVDQYSEFETETQ
jgi:ABC-type uncharacterized transport system auxiliary subunit